MEKREIHNLALYIAPFGIKNLLPLISLPIFTRYILPDEFGLYALAILYGTICSGIANFGLTGVFERTFFEIDKNKRKDLLFTVLLFVLTISLIILLVTFYFNQYLSKIFFSPYNLNEYLFFGLLFQTTKSLNFYFILYLKSYENAKKYSYVVIIESLLIFIFSLLFVIHYSMGLYGFFIGQCLGAIITFLMIFFNVFFPLKNKFDFDLLKSQLKLSILLTPNIFFGIINSQFDRYMLGFLTLLGGVGIYDIGQKIANTSFVFLNTISNVFTPQVYKRFFSNDNKTINSVGKYLTPFFYLSTFFPLIIGIFSFEILVILTTPDYYDGAPVISILSILYAFYFFGKQPQLIYVKKTGLISFISFISILLNIALNIPFIHFFGIIGAAIATCLSGIITNLMNFYYSQKHNPINWENRVFILLGFFIVAIVSVMCLDFLNIPYLILLLIKVVFLIGYLIFGIKYGFLSITAILKKINQ